MSFDILSITKLISLGYQYTKFNQLISIYTQIDAITCFNKYCTLISHLNDNNISMLIDELSCILKQFGTLNFRDMIQVCHGNLDINDDKYSIIINSFHPTGYIQYSNTEWIKMGGKKTQLSCILSGNKFYLQCHGLSIGIYTSPKTVIVFNGYVTDIPLELIQDNFINQTLLKIKSLGISSKFIKSLTIRDLLSLNISEIVQLYNNTNTWYCSIKATHLSLIVEQFTNNDLFEQRTMIIKLLIKECDTEFEYISYILFDLLSKDKQDQVYDSFPANIKAFFKNASIHTIDYTSSFYTIGSVPLEQQICALKATDYVKNKAIIKLQELKTDTSSKASQYLEGLIKIPFNIFHKTIFTDILCHHNLEFSKHFNTQNKHSYIEMCFIVKNAINIATKEAYAFNLSDLSKSNASTICSIISPKHKNLSKQQMILNICNVKNNEPFLFENAYTNVFHANLLMLSNTLQSHKFNIQQYLKKTHDTIDNSVYGHFNAKKQLDRIIGQWVNGDSDGYCLGFEGPPGVGKTSIAKHGLSQCLMDLSGNNRPFAFIALGGSTNSSTLNGHNYTYSGSMWGKIVDILIQTKCMNPIIFIDELDKISNTDQGKEIVGILTHIIDSTQNNAFQDNYFSGIDIDLSKVLFVFSYNDPSLIDKILIDRIHRIKFEPLTVVQKIYICNHFIIPELTKRVGVSKLILFEDNVIQQIIISYTLEPGVRKLKEIMFEIIGEINLHIINSDITELPISLSFFDIKTKFLFQRTPIFIPIIISEPSIGTVNGLWANSQGQGGVLPIEVSYCTSSEFLRLTLTGLQGNVMKESMNVALTVAWSLLKQSEQIFIKSDNSVGIHVHCPEAAVHKDGPSAGAAITVAMYSILTNKRINNKVALTGEINLQGHVTAIGGLNLKISGGLDAGVTTFIYPQANESDFIRIKTEFNHLLDGITFHAVSTIQEILDIIML
jgi:hypothetical protein